MKRLVSIKVIGLCDHKTYYYKLVVVVFANETTAFLDIEKKLYTLMFRITLCSEYFVCPKSAQKIT